MNLMVNSSPHIRGTRTTAGIMRDVIIALVPAILMGGYFFGVRALAVIAVSVLSALAGEWLWQRLGRRENTLSDGSAAVTGILLALTLPASVPYWVAAVGSLFAVIVVKGVSGGLGQNIFNPALGARAFLLLLFPAQVTRYAAAGEMLPLTGAVDLVTGPTPLHEMQMRALPSASLWEMFFGSIAGSIGEVSALALLLGGIYLAARRVIRVRIPLAYLGTVSVLSLLFAKGEDPVLWMLYSVLGGGVMLGAIFMATDYTTSPVTPLGQIFYGVGIGVLTVFFRYQGLFPEGVTYAILLMNAAAWLLDQLTMPRRFGCKKGEKV